MCMPPRCNDIIGLCWIGGVEMLNKFFAHSIFTGVHVAQLSIMKMLVLRSQFPLIFTNLALLGIL